MATKAAEEYDADRDFSVYITKAPSAMVEHFHDWVLEKTGYDPSTAKTKDEAFAQGIKIGTALRGLHQASPENQERLAEARAAAKEAAAAAPVEKAPKPAKAAKAAKAVAPVVETETETEEVITPAPRKAAKKAARRPVAAVATEEDEQAPF